MTHKPVLDQIRDYIQKHPLPLEQIMRIRDEHNLRVPRPVTYGGLMRPSLTPEQVEQTPQNDNTHT
jgi:hypothetical protein